MAHQTLLFAFTFATFLLAGLVKGVIGLGLPTVVIGLLAVVMPPAQAAALLVVPSLVTNLWQSAVGPHLAALLRRLWPMLLGICAGTWAGARFLPGTGGPHATAALGIALVVYAIVGLSAFRIVVPARAETWLSFLVGSITGLITAATGVFVIPAVPYLQALDLDKDELVQALGLSFMVSTAALATILVQAGALQLDIAGASALAIVPAVIGMALGQRLRGRVPPAAFRLCFFVGLLLLGAHLALRPWL
jgi:uncharacterized membrane protein YfcA